MTIEENIEKIFVCQTVMQADIKDIKKQLAGDDFGNDGLIKQHKTLKMIVYELRDDVKKFKIIGGVLFTILTLVISGIKYFEK